MLISLQNFTRITVAVVFTALASSSGAEAQVFNLADSPANSFGESMTGFLDGFTIDAASHRPSDVDALYESNSRKPLGGFFAKGFTRTFTVLGGVGFSTADLPSDFAGITPLPTTATSGPVDALSALFPEEDVETTDTGYAISAAMGRRHSKTLRSEIEVAVRGNEFSRSTTNGFPPSDLSADVTAVSLLKNVIFEFPNQSRFTPYGGAGIGISWIDVDAGFENGLTAGEISDDESAFTYQFIGGVSTRVNRATDFVVEYRFLGTNEIELDSIGAFDYQTNNLFLGVKLEY